MRIVGLIGFQGSGKTLTMTKLLHDKWRKEDRVVLSNYWLGFPHETLEAPTIDDDDNLNYGEIFNRALGMDELHTWFDSYCSMNATNRILSYFFTQLRKRDNDLFYSTQHFGQVGKRLRDNTHYLILCDSYVKVCPKKHDDTCSPYARNFENKCRDCKYFVKNDIFKAPFHDGMPALSRKILRQESIWPLFNSKEIIKPRTQTSDNEITIPSSPMNRAPDGALLDTESLLQSAKRIAAKPDYRQFVKGRRIIPDDPSSLIPTSQPLKTLAHPTGYEGLA